MTLPKQLARLQAQHPDMIEEIIDETDSGDGYWVHFKPGWRDWNLECHFIHEDTVKEVLAAFRHHVEVCNCPECAKAKARPAERQPGASDQED